MTDLAALAPPLTLLCALGSLVVHYQEYQEDGHPLDLEAIHSLERSQEVSDWLNVMTQAGYLPVKRRAR